ncbi:unnamed protein product [Darwinula stevensoni]|uniref:Uncharacterized protein n=1 Tax=Darwinula stevensoni TaxID=69355 RepID=A0A7R9A8U4_9CRUS|nr:unnamed protein product [Darwinula stevensoni]CAG0896658.1 unnamed protein product [Darwinula stevensoni]
MEMRRGNKEVSRRHASAQARKGQRCTIGCRLRSLADFRAATDASDLARRCLDGSESSADTLRGSSEDVAEEVLDAAAPLDHRAHSPQRVRPHTRSFRLLRESQFQPSRLTTSSSELKTLFSLRETRQYESSTLRRVGHTCRSRSTPASEEVLERFCDWHDMHGLYFLRNRESLGVARWLTWVAVEVSLIACCLYGCYSPIMNLVNGKHSVSIDMDGALLKRRVLPDLICPTNPLREDAIIAALGVKQEILEYAMGALYRGGLLSQNLRSDEVRRDRLEAELHEILRSNHTTIPHLLISGSLRCEDMVISCELGGESRVVDSDQCCSEIFLSRPLTSMGPCISTHGYTRYQNYPGASMGLSVMLRVFNSTWLDRSVLSGLAQADGYKAVLTANYESPSLAAKMRAHAINPGRKTLLGLQAVRVSILGWRDRLERVISHSAFFVADLVKKECKPLCTETSYEVLVSYDHLSSAYVESVIQQLRHKLTKSEEVAVIGVHYNMLSERVISYSAFSVVDLISSTGGILGLIIGGSVLTVIQFLTLWLAHRFASSVGASMS